VVEPSHDLAVLIGFLHGDVGHVAVGSRAVPVLFARLDVDDITGTDLLDAVTCCNEADAVSDV
jgi:hypothetical protein